MATLEELKQAMVAADAAGETEDARILAAMYRREKDNAPDPMLPTVQPGVPDPVNLGGGKADPGRSVGETAQGALEATGTLLSGATGGLIGSVVGAAEGLVAELSNNTFGTQAGANRIAEQSQKRASDLTYVPESEAGLDMVQGVGKALEPLAALAPPLAGEAQIIRNAARNAVGAVTDQAAGAAVGAGKVGASVRERLPFGSKTEAPTPLPAGNVGAASAGRAAGLQSAADSLPVPIKLTKGEATGDQTQQKFESDTSKKGDIGAPLRDDAELKNTQLSQNMESFIDDSGAVLSELPEEMGGFIQKTLNDMRGKRKDKVRALYKDFDKSAEADEIVDVNSLAQAMNENRALRVQDGLMTKLQRQIGAMEVGAGDFAEGSLQLKKMTFRQSEDLRKFINGATDWKDPTQVGIASKLKQAIDSSTADAGGPKIKAARAERRQLAEDFENVGIVRDLTGSKRGSDERAIAMESVLKKTVLQPSASNESLQHVKRLLTSGEVPDGAQAWKEVQGATLAYIRNMATKSSQATGSGSVPFSASGLQNALKPLIDSGKINTLFDKKTSTNLLLLSDVAKAVRTRVDGAVNHSNNVSAIAGLADVLISGGVGLPMPIASATKAMVGKLNDRKLAARVADALKGIEEPKL